MSPPSTAWWASATRFAWSCRPRGIKVGVILPGLIDTGFNDSVEGSKPGALRPADVAAAVVAMLSQPAGAQIDELTVHPMSQDA